MALGGRGGIVQALMEQQGLVSPVRDINEFALPETPTTTPQERIEQGFEDLPPPSEPYSQKLEEFLPPPQSESTPPFEGLAGPSEVQTGQSYEGSGGLAQIYRDALQGPGQYQENDPITTAPPTGQDNVDPGIFQQQPPEPGEQEGGGYYIPEQQVNFNVGSSTGVSRRDARRGY